MLRALLIALVLLGWPVLVRSADPAKLELVLSGLDQPTAVAIQPKTNGLFVADSAAGKIVRVVDGQATDVITGFAKSSYRHGAEFEAGPLGLAFLDADTLVVVGNGSEVGPRLSVFNAPVAGKSALTAASAKVPSQTLPADGRGPGEEHFWAVATTPAGIYIAVHGNDGPSGGGLIAKAEVRGTKIGELRRFMTSKESALSSPAGIAIGPRGEIAVAYQGRSDTPGDSQLVFLNAKQGQQLLTLKSGLSDVVALAYSPKGQLYALDAAWHDPAQSGLFQLVADFSSGELQIKAIKIAAVSKPSSLAFTSDGTLYITTLGAAPEGKLWKIAPGL